jgi:hypothetical protein
VATARGIALATLSRWKAEPAFQNAMRQPLREHLGSMQLAMFGLTTESIGQLHSLVNSFSERILPTTCALALGRVSPVLQAVSRQLGTDTADSRNEVP